MPYYKECETLSVVGQFICLPDFMMLGLGGLLLLTDIYILLRCKATLIGRGLNKEMGGFYVNFKCGASVTRIWRQGDF